MQPKTYVIQKRQQGLQLIDFLSVQLKASRKKAKKLCDDRMVFVNGQRVWMARHELRAGDQIEIHLPAEAPRTPQRLRVLYEDAQYLAINKPPGVLSEGPESAETALQTQFNEPEICAVHRLDRDTSGCLLFARTPAARDAMIPLFKNRLITKVYHALVAGKVSAKLRQIETPIEGQPAKTRIQLLAARGLASHLKIAIDTGRTHQIRLHLQAANHPVLGEKQHASSHALAPELRDIPRQMLHAFRLVFTHPATGEVIRISAPIPADFNTCLRNLRLT